VGNTKLRVLRIGPKNYPPDHGGVEKNASLLVQLMPWIENHVFTEQEPREALPRVWVLPKGFMSQVKQLRQYAARNHIDIVHAHKETFIPLALCLKLCGYPCVVTVHGCAWRLRRWPRRIRVLLFLLDVVACWLMDATVFVGEHDYRLFRRIVPHKRLHLIRNGVTTDERKESQRTDRAVYLGRLSPEKNIVALIEAATAAGLQLDLYGPLDRRDAEFQLRIKYALDNSKYVKWMGKVDAANIEDTLGKYRIFINPSFSEGMPTSVLEAASQGLFLVLSDIAAHRVLGLPGCLYIDPNNLSLQDVPSEVEMLHRKGRANRQHVKTRFSIQKTIEAYDELYGSLS